jgi:hypothetical protein
MAEEVEGDNVLDLGYADMPNKYLPAPARRVVGVDLVAPSGRSGYDEEIQGDVMALFLEGGFTTVLAGELVEHLENPYEFTRRTRELLVDGGRLVISTPNPLGFPMVLFELAQSRRRFYAADHTYALTPRWVRRMLESCGYALEKSIAVGLWNPWLPFHLCPVTLSYQVIYLARAI